MYTLKDGTAVDGITAEQMDAALSVYARFGGDLEDDPTAERRVAHVVAVVAALGSERERELEVAARHLYLCLSSDDSGFTCAGCARARKAIWPRARTQAQIVAVRAEGHS